MTQQFNGNNTLSNDNVYINYAINNVMLNTNTLLPCKITAISGLTATVEPIINIMAINQPTPKPAVINNVPICQLIGGDAGIEIEYQVGDVVLCGAVQRDISNIKKSWARGNPASGRKFSLSDVVILFKLSNELPTTKIKITKDNIKIIGKSVKITADDVTVDSDNATVNSTNVNLGVGANLGVLLENTPLVATLVGTYTPTGGTGTITITSGGSSTVKGVI